MEIDLRSTQSSQTEPELRVAERKDKHLTDEKPKILDSVAKLWIMDAHEQTGSHTPVLQTLIDGVADHNQLMLDCVENVSDDLRDVINELMESEDPKDQELWMAITTRLFDKVDEMLKAST